MGTTRPRNRTAPVLSRHLLPAPVSIVRSVRGHGVLFGAEVFHGFQARQSGLRRRLFLSSSFFAETTAGKPSLRLGLLAPSLVPACFLGWLHRCPVRLFYSPCDLAPASRYNPGLPPGRPSARLRIHDEAASANPGAGHVSLRLLSLASAKGGSPFRHPRRFCSVFSRLRVPFHPHRPPSQVPSCCAPADFLPKRNPLHAPFYPTIHKPL